MLSYYSMQLFPMLFMEGCFSLYVQNHFIKTRENLVGTAFSIEGFKENAKFFAYLLKNEHMFNYDNFD